MSCYTITKKEVLILGWIIWLSVEVLLYLIILFIKWLYQKEDRMMLLNDYELIESLQEPQRSSYIKESKRQTILLLYGFMFILLLGALIHPFINTWLFVIGLLIIISAYCIIMIRASIQLTKQYKKKEL